MYNDGICPWCDFVGITYLTYAYKPLSVIHCTNCCWYRCKVARFEGFANRVGWNGKCYTDEEFIKLRKLKAFL